jgi:hypothetical protein
VPGPPMPRRAAAVAAEAFVVTYPLVLMDLTRAQLTATATAGPLRAPVNQFAHMPGFPLAASAPVVTPNVDTLMSSAWLDLTEEPLVLSLPDTGGRYYAMPIRDAWTTTFGSLGTRTTGNAARQVVLVPPRWRGRLPRDLHVVQSPTSHAWIVGHIRSDGPHDHPTVRRLQEQIRLTPLSRWPQDRERARGPSAITPVDPTSPATRIARMDPGEYFTRVAHLLAVDPPHRGDRSRVERMSALGVGAGEPPAWTRADRPLVREITRGMAEGLAQVEAAATGPGLGGRPWTCPSDLVRRRAGPLERAALAWTGLDIWPRPDGVCFPDRARRRGAPRPAPQPTGRRRQGPAVARPGRVDDDPPVRRPAALGGHELAPDPPRALWPRPAPVLAGGVGPRRHLVATGREPGRERVRPGGGRPARRDRLTRQYARGGTAVRRPRPSPLPTRTAPPQ